MKHTCVIGGSGFIGTAVVRELIKNGRNVTVLDTKAPASSNVNYKIGDYGDRDFLLKALVGCDEVIVLAYASVPKTSYEDPMADILSNVPRALVLFETIARLPIDRVVIASSGGAVYGLAREIPIVEDHPTNPISPYGITKLTIEKYAHMYHVLHQLPYVIVRPANAYGEDQKPFTGQGFLATAIAQVLQGKEIVLFGETGSVRDYIHVEDVASGIFYALTQGQIAGIYNLGTGIGTSNLEIVTMIEKLAADSGLAVKMTTLPARGFDVPENILNITKLIQVGWPGPKVTLEKGIKKVWDHFKSTHKSP